MGLRRVARDVAARGPRSFGPGQVEGDCTMNLWGGFTWLEGDGLF